jgi:hypothetical protein
VRLAAETLRRNYPQKAEAIIRRWIGESARYGKI